ncbi:hypothetical protein HK097_002959, partial [Rhizophlyctis rosea]
MPSDRNKVKETKGKATEAPHVEVNGDVRATQQALPDSKNDPPKKEEKEKVKRGFFGFGKSDSGAKKEENVLHAAATPAPLPASNAKDTKVNAASKEGKPKQGDAKQKGLKDSSKVEAIKSEAGQTMIQSKDGKKAPALEQKVEPAAEKNGNVGPKGKKGGLMDDRPPFGKRPGGGEREPISELTSHAGNGKVEQQEVFGHTDSRGRPMGEGDVNGGIKDRKRLPRMESTPTANIHPSPTDLSLSHNLPHTTSPPPTHPSHASPPPDNRSLTTQERRPGLKKVYFDPRTKEFFMSSHDLHSIVSGSPFTSSDSDFPSRKSHTRSSSFHHSAPRNNLHPNHNLETEEQQHEDTSSAAVVPPTSRRHKRTTTEPVPVPSYKVPLKDSSTSSDKTRLRRLRSLDLSQSETDLGSEFIHPAIVKRVEKEEPFPVNKAQKRDGSEEGSDEEEGGG